MSHLIPRETVSPKELNLSIVSLLKKRKKVSRRGYPGVAHHHELPLGGTLLL